MWIIESRPLHKEPSEVTDQKPLLDGAFRTPAEEEMKKIEGRVEAMTLGLTNQPPQEVIRAQHEWAVAQAMGRSKD